MVKVDGESKFDLANEFVLNAFFGAEKESELLTKKKNNAIRAKRICWPMAVKIRHILSKCRPIHSQLTHHSVPKIMTLAYWHRAERTTIIYVCAHPQQKRREGNETQHYGRGENELIEFCCTKHPQNRLAIHNKIIKMGAEKGEN